MSCFPWNLPRGSISGTVGVEENALSESARDYAQRTMHCCKIMDRLARWLKCGLISFLPLSNNRLCLNCNVVTEEIFPPIQWSWSLGQASSVCFFTPHNLSLTFLLLLSYYGLSSPGLRSSDSLIQMHLRDRCQYSLEPFRAVHKN